MRLQSQAFPGKIINESVMRQNLKEREKKTSVTIQKTKEDQITCPYSNDSNDDSCLSTMYGHYSIISNKHSINFTSSYEISLHFFSLIFSVSCPFYKMYINHQIQTPKMILQCHLVQDEAHLKTISPTLV